MGEDAFSEGIKKICSCTLVEKLPAGTLIRCKEQNGKDAPNNVQFKHIGIKGLCVATDIDLVGKIYYTMIHTARMYNCPYIRTEFD
jgi:hypothetical protein